MFNIKKLRDRRAALTNEGGAILKAGEGQENGKLTPEQKSRLSAIKVERDELDEDIERIEAQMDAERKIGARALEIPEGARVQVGDDNAAKGFESFGHMLQAVHQAGTPGGAVDPRLKYRSAATGSNETIQGDGGFLVSKEESTELLKNAYDSGEIAKRCRRRTIGAGKNGFAQYGIDETSRANGSRWGGVQSYWADEAELKTASRPKFRRMELKLKKLIGLHYVTDELLEDAVALEQESKEIFASEFAFKIDDAIIRGTGVGQPLGIINSPALVTVAAAGGQAADTIVYENIVAMWSRMWARSRKTAVWLVNQEAEPQLFSMALVIGTGGVPVYLPASGGISGEPNASLFNRPVIAVEQSAALGDVGDIMLADFSQYLLIDKGGMKSDMSIHVRFIYDESVFRYVLRIDGQPLANTPITPYLGSASLGSFVALAAR